MGEFSPFNQEQDKKDDELRTFLKELVDDQITDLTDENIESIVDRARTNPQLIENWHKYGAKRRKKTSN